jgi:hypothetical protein
MELEKPVICTECGRSAARLRKDRCDACYMRLYRGGEIPEGACCAACGERRREVLVRAELGPAEEIVCGNCAVLLRRVRPRLLTIADLRARALRERRRSDRRDFGAPMRRATDALPSPPPLDPSID